MAIFSSNKKKKEAPIHGSPPMGTTLNRVQGMTQGPSPQPMQQAPPNSTLLPYHRPQQASLNQPSQNQGPPPTQSAVYPWSQHKLLCAPSSLLAPPESGKSFLPGPISTSPFPRYGHSVNPSSLPSGDVYIFGGLVAEQVRNDLYVLSHDVLRGSTSSPSGLSVSLVETRGNIPGPRVGHASVAVGNVLIVWGGDTKNEDSEDQDDSLYLLNLSTREWTRVTTVGTVPEGRYGHAACMVGSRFYIFGGQKDHGVFLNDLCWFDLQKLKAGTPRWSFVEQTPNAVLPPRRTGHTMVPHGDCIYIFGGTDGAFHYNDTWCFDTTRNVWTELTCIGYIPSPREGHAAALVDDVMYIFSGRGIDGFDLDDLAAFKISSRRWFMFQNMGPAPGGRSGHAMTASGNKVYVLGGESFHPNRKEDPSVIHILDTSKIKYPSDSKIPPLSKKTSNPSLNGSQSSITTGSLSGIRKPGSSQGYPQGRVQSPTEFGERRATSPQNRQNGSAPNSGISFGQAGSINSTLTGYQQRGYGDTTRSGRPGEMEYVNPAEVRSKSPPNGTYSVHSHTSSVGNGSNSDLPYSQQMPDSASTPAHAPLPNSNSQSSIAVSARQDSLSTQSSPRARSPTSLRNDPIAKQYEQDRLLNNETPNQASRAGMVKSATNDSIAPATGHGSDQLEQLRARNQWLLGALLVAKKKGYVFSDETHLQDVNEIEDQDSEILLSLIELKKELADAKSVLNEQAKEMNGRLAEFAQAKSVAVQEASFYRAKLTAIESNSDVGKLDKERIADLEKRLNDALVQNNSLQYKVEQLSVDLVHQSEQRAEAEERCTHALTRADTAEQANSRSLSEFEAVQSQSNTHETSLAENLGKMAIMTSSLQILEAENSHLKESVQRSDTTVAIHVRAIEESHNALLAAEKQNSEIKALYEKTLADFEKAQEFIAKLSSELESKKSELTLSLERVSDLERLLQTEQEASAASKTLATGGLAELLQSYRETQSRSLPDSVHQERLKASETEVTSTRKLFETVQAKANSHLSELNESKKREAEMRAELQRLQSESNALRAQNAAVLSDLHSANTTATERLRELEHISKTRDAAEIKLKILCSVNGPEDKSEERPALTGDESAEELRGRVQKLELLLEQKTQVPRELQDQSQHLQTRSVGGGDEESLRAELEELKEKYKPMEASHNKAIHYVKSVEKMLRKMKDELKRQKEHNVQLEATISQNANLQSEHDLIKRQLHETTSLSTAYSAQREALERQLAVLQADYDHQHSEAERKIAELERDVEQLYAEITRVRQELDESLAINSNLNDELQQALEKTAPAGSRGDEVRRLEQELSTALSRAEWLRNENDSLEKRCELAEQKIGILLDHMEGESTTGDFDNHVNWSQRNGSISDGVSEYSNTEFQQPSRQYGNGLMHTSGAAGSLPGNNFSETLGPSMQFVPGRSA